MILRLDEILERIITVNHAWKLSKDEFSNEFAVTQSLRWTKSSLQATLLREFPSESSLKVASDNDEHGELLYSVRLTSSVVVNGAIRNDAEHLPARIAKDIFTPEEIQSFLNR